MFSQVYAITDARNMPWCRMPLLAGRYPLLRGDRPGYSMERLRKCSMNARNARVGCFDGG